LAVLLQLPLFFQLEHLIDHEEIKHCDATGFTKHFHADDHNDCDFLHRDLSFHFTYSFYTNEFFSVSSFFAFIHALNNQIQEQLLPFATLRAPPFVK